MKVWITKYALTQGIIKSEAEDCGDRMIRVKNENGYFEYYHGEGKEWHKTEESAIEKAEQMRQKKIESLKKQIQKLEKMKFSKEEEISVRK